MESAWYYPRTGQATPQKAESRIMGQSAANNPAHQPRQWTCGGASKNQKKAPCHICSAGNYLHAQKNWQKNIEYLEENKISSEEMGQNYSEKMKGKINSGFCTCK